MAEKLTDAQARTEAIRMVKTLRVFENAEDVLSRAMSAEGRLRSLTDNVARLEGLEREADAERVKAQAALTVANNAHTGRMNETETEWSGKLRELKRDYTKERTRIKGVLEELEAKAAKAREDRELFKANAAEERVKLEDQLSSLRSQITTIKADVAKLHLE